MKKCQEWDVSFRRTRDEIAIANYVLSQQELRDLMQTRRPVHAQGKLAILWAHLKAS